jgi:hypothetical protein
VTVHEDAEVLRVFEHLVTLDPTQERIGATIRQTLDQLYDGQHTGRFRWEDLYKTEKTHCGTLVEINLQREFDFSDGLKLDYLIVGIEVDCKYSQAFGGWMIPNEATNEICLVVTASDKSSTFSAGVVRAREEWLNVGRNRDAKATLNLLGREQIFWLARDAPLPPNVLLGLEPLDLEVIFSFKSGQKRVNELFRRAQLLAVGRGVVATVAQQEDYMKRVRGNGGARTALKPEGIVIFGQYAAHGGIMKALGLPALRRGESMSVRLVPSVEDVPWSTRIDGAWWRVAKPDDPVEVAPELPRVSVAS